MLISIKWSLMKTLTTCSYFVVKGENRGERLALFMRSWATTEFDVIICTGGTPSHSFFSSWRRSQRQLQRQSLLTLLFKIFFLLFVSFIFTCQLDFQMNDKRKHFVSRRVRKKRGGMFLRTCAVRWKRVVGRCFCRDEWIQWKWY